MPQVRMSAAERAAAGARLLDTFHGAPTWVSQIDLGKLDVRFSDVCPLGQLFGDFSAANGLGVGTLRQAERMGFLPMYYDPDHMEDQRMVEDSRELDRAWVAEIECRKSMSGIQVAASQQEVHRQAVAV